MKAMAHILLGLEHTKRSEYDLAVKEFDQAIALKPKSAEGYFYRAFALSYIRDGSIASQADYKTAAKLDSGAFGTPHGGRLLISHLLVR